MFHPPNSLMKTVMPPVNSSAAALTSGYGLAFWVMAGIAFAGAVLAFVLVRVRAEDVADVEGAGAVA